MPHFRSIMYNRLINEKKHNIDFFLALDYVFFGSCGKY